MWNEKRKAHQRGQTLFTRIISADGFICQTGPLFYCKYVNFSLDFYAAVSYEISDL